MSFLREVITLQIGNYSNYVGAHWWNIQVSNDSIMYFVFEDNTKIDVFFL